MRVFFYNYDESETNLKKKSIGSRQRTQKVELKKFVNSW